MGRFLAAEPTGRVGTMLEGRPMKKSHQAGIAIIAALLAAWFTYPWTRSQCIDQAASMPTEAGVRAKYAQCNKDFAENPKPASNYFDRFDGAEKQNK